MKRIFLALLLTVAFAVPAFSQMNHHEGKGMQGKGHTGGHHQMMEMGDMDKMGNMMGMCLQHADRLGLTDQQVVKLKAIHRALEKKQVMSKAELRIARIELTEIMEVKDFDLELANAAAGKISQIKTAQHLEMLKSMKEVRNLLTNEQFAKMKKMMPRMMTGKKAGKVRKLK